MSSFIVDTVRSLRSDIEANGVSTNGTMEMVGIVLPHIEVNSLDLVAEEIAIRDYYASSGINWQSIRSLEHNLYEFIYRGLRQSVEQLLYFDMTQSHSSRRFVFSTSDCISHVQIIHRHSAAMLFAHIRSTDVVKLLPWDLLFLAKVTNRILEDCEFPHTTRRTVHVTIASAHYYPSPARMY